MTGFVQVSAHVAGRPIVNPTTGAPTADHLRQLNDNIRNIRVAIGQLATVVDDIQASLTQAGIALTTAEAVRAELEAKVANDDLINSFTDPSLILSAADAGGTATITIADHTRHYGDGSSVAVMGGTITDLALGTTYYVVYSDEERTGGTVTFSAITNPSMAGQGLGQHLCGDITTPAAGGTSTDGGGVTPPRVRYVQRNEIENVSAE